MKIIELKSTDFSKNYIRKILEKNICLIGVFSKLCIHCTNMKPQWELLKKKLKRSKCNGVLLEIDSNSLPYIDFSSLTNSIKGLPSIMIYKNGKKEKEFSDERTSDNMFKFLKPYLVLRKNKTKKYKRYNNTKRRKNKRKTHRK